MSEPQVINNQKATIRVIVVARQPGSAMALISLVRALKEEECLVLGLDHAWQTWSMAGITAHAVTSFTDALRYLSAVQPRVLLTGTSLNAVDDGLFWHWARERAIPAIAFVDHWTNYQQRFSSTPDHLFDCLPDRIAVIDTLMAQRLIAAGCPPQRIVVLGHPGWDDLWHWRDRHSSGLSRALAADSRLIVFVSEPCARVYGPRGTPNSLGYTEGDALDLLLHALEIIGTTRGETYTVAVKPHPLGDSVPLMVTKKLVRTCVAEFDRLELVAAAAVVTGMNSLLLYEAALMGRPVVALQPGRVAHSDLVDHHPGILLAVDTQQAVCALTRALNGEISAIPNREAAIPQWLDMLSKI